MVRSGRLRGNPPGYLRPVTRSTQAGMGLRSGCPRGGRELTPKPGSCPRLPRGLQGACRGWEAQTRGRAPLGRRAVRTGPGRAPAAPEWAARIFTRIPLGGRVHGLRFGNKTCWLR